MISKKQIKELDDLHREITMKRNQYCIITMNYPSTPDRKERIDATDRHHVFGRAYSVRWLIENGQGLHRYNHNHTPEMHQKCKELFIQRWGLEKWDELNSLSNQPCPRVDYEEIKDYLTEQLDMV